MGCGLQAVVEKGWVRAFVRRGPDTRVAHLAWQAQRTLPSGRPSVSFAAARFGSWHSGPRESCAESRLPGAIPP